jgi:hypothetical protein
MTVTLGQLVLMFVVQLVCAVIVGVPCFFLGHQHATMKAERERDRAWDEEHR